MSEAPTLFDELHAVAQAVADGRRAQELAEARRRAEEIWPEVVELCRAAARDGRFALSIRRNQHAHLFPRAYDLRQHAAEHKLGFISTTRYCEEVNLTWARELE